jgi:hypothetical protein
MNIFKNLLLAFFLFPLFSFAQSNYKPGYVVALKGDTLHGFIDYRGWDANPMTVSFKSTVGDNKPQKLTMGDISFFCIDGVASYKKYICSISMDETNTSKLGTARDTSYKIDTVFLQILQKGKNVTLYSYTDGLKTRFYIGEAPGYTPTELIYRIYDDTGIAAHKEGNTVIENTYLKQLFALANKYNVLDNDLERTLQSANYAEPDMLAIVSKINSISKSEYVKKYADRGKLNFYVGAALNIAGTSSNSSAPYEQDGGKSQTSFGPAILFGLNVIPNPNSDRIEFRAELSIAESKFSSSYKLNVSPYIPVTASFNQLGIAFSPHIVYNFYSADNLKIYFGGGVNITHFVFSNATFGSTDPKVSDSDIGETDPYNFYVNETSVMLKAGVKIDKKFEIFVEYFTPTVLTNSGYFQFDTDLKQIGLVYFLGK